MDGGLGFERTAVAGIVATLVGLMTVAVQPPTALSPVGFLGTLTLGAGLGITAVAWFRFVASRVVVPEGDGPAGNSRAGGSSPERSGGAAHDSAGDDGSSGGLAETEALLRGGAAGDERSGDLGPSRAAEVATGPNDPEDADEEEFIWGTGGDGR